MIGSSDFNDLYFEKIDQIDDDNYIINWKAKTLTYKYHWWPMYQHRKNDIVNNSKCNNHSK